VPRQLSDRQREFGNATPCEVTSRISNGFEIRRSGLPFLIVTSMLFARCRTDAAHLHRYGSDKARSVGQKEPSDSPATLRPWMRKPHLRAIEMALQARVQKRHYL